MLCCAEPVVLNYGVLCWASGCESLCAILSQLLWIMFCYADPVVVNLVVLCWTSGCESCCVILNKWFSIIVCYAEPVVVIDSVLNMIHNHRLSITHHDSKPLSKHNTPCFTTTGWAKNTMNHNHWLSITHHDSKPLSQHNTACFTAPYTI
jgi:hypothetical protein